MNAIAKPQVVTIKLARNFGPSPVEKLIRTIRRGPCRERQLILGRFDRNMEKTRAPLATVGLRMYSWASEKTLMKPESSM